MTTSPGVGHHSNYFPPFIHWPALGDYHMEDEMRGPDPERRVRKFICEDTLPRGCENWDGNRCIIEADEDCCADAYNDGAFPWDAYKDEMREQMEERMEDKEPTLVCDVLMCEYRGGPDGCLILADPHECGIISGEYCRSEWEAYVAHRKSVLLECADELRAEGVVR